MCDWNAPSSCLNLRAAHLSVPSRPELAKLFFSSVDPLFKYGKPSQPNLALKKMFQSTNQIKSQVKMWICGNPDIHMKMICFIWFLSGLTALWLKAKCTVFLFFS